MKVECFSAKETLFPSLLLPVVLRANLGKLVFSPSTVSWQSCYKKEVCHLCGFSSPLKRRIISVTDLLKKYQRCLN